MRITLMAAAAALCLQTLPASAQEFVGNILFGPNDNPTEFFTQTYIPTQTVVSNGLDLNTFGYQQRNSDGSYTSHTTGELILRDAADGGGIYASGADGIDLRGPQVYYGDHSPLTDYGTIQYGLYGTVGNSAPGYYQIFFASSDPDITSAAPEPGVWALMLAGVAMVGATLRFGRRQRALSA